MSKSSPKLPSPAIQSMVREHYGRMLQDMGVAYGRITAHNDISVTLRDVSPDDFITLEESLAESETVHLLTDLSVAGNVKLVDVEFAEHVQQNFDIYNYGVDRSEGTGRKLTAAEIAKREQRARIRERIAKLRDENNPFGDSE